MIKIKNNFLRDNYLILVLLSVHFLVNIAIYLNTNSFYEISESGSNFDAYYSLIKGERILPIDGGFFLTPAFVAFFINKLTGGGLFYYFIFQILLSTITVYIIYNIILRITESKKQAILSIIFITCYLEYDLLGSVFYNQIYEIFFVSIFIFITIAINNAKKIPALIIYSSLILIITFLSLFFRLTLVYSFLLFIFMLFFNVKSKINLVKFSVLAVLSFVIISAYNPSKIYNYHHVDYRQLWFWGHTMYGGLGGEASFVYPENEERYNKRFQQYLKDNKIDTVTLEVIGQFRIAEVKTFIKNEPHKWLFLQIKKVFYTFDSVPQKDGLLMLYKGKIKMPWLIAALIIQLSYAVILIMFLITVDLNYKKIIQDKYKRIIYFLGLYLIGGICIFSAYQERYRVVVFVCFFIPVIAININKFKTILLKENRRELIIKLIIILILFAVWIYQAYEALYIYHDRYFKVVQ